MSDLTHYEGCYTEHIGCALALLQRVVERARREGVMAGREEAARVCYYHAECCKLAGQHAASMIWEQAVAAIRALLPADSEMVMVSRTEVENAIRRMESNGMSEWKECKMLRAMLSAHEVSDA